MDEVSDECWPLGIHPSLIGPHLLLWGLFRTFVGLCPLCVLGHRAGGVVISLPFCIHGQGFTHENFDCTIAFGNDGHILTLTTRA
jgi:hypothetical protein